MSSTGHLTAGTVLVGLVVFAAGRVEAPTSSEEGASLDGTGMVLVVGLPKSGTSSLQRYFACGNRTATHWTCGDRHCAHVIQANLAAGRAPLDGVDPRATVHTQLDYWGPPAEACFFPQVDALDALSRAYPRATLVLPTRPVEHWIRSVSTWTTDLADATGGVGTLTARELLARCDIGSLPRGAGARDDELRAWYEGHSRAVRAHAAARPAHALVAIDIESGAAAAAALEAAFGIPEACWPHANRWQQTLSIPVQVDGGEPLRVDVEPGACRGAAARDGCRAQFAALCRSALGIREPAAAADCAAGLAAEVASRLRRTVAEDMVAHVADGADGAEVWRVALHFGTDSGAAAFADDAASLRWIAAHAERWRAHCEADASAAALGAAGPAACAHTVAAIVFECDRRARAAHEDERRRGGDLAVVLAKGNCWLELSELDGVLQSYREARVLKIL